VQFAYIWRNKALHEDEGGLVAVDDDGQLVYPCGFRLDKAVPLEQTPFWT
jgi:hypothetical protein